MLGRILWIAIWQNRGIEIQVVALLPWPVLDAGRHDGNADNASQARGPALHKDGMAEKLERMFLNPLTVFAHVEYHSQNMLLFS